VRTCTDCNVTKPLTEFTPIKGTSYTHTRCKPCRAPRARAANAFAGSASTTPATASSKRPKPNPDIASSVLSRSSEPQPSAAMRTCTECGQPKAIEAFVRIRACKAGWYGRCRACRNARARARYWSTPEILVAERERARRNERLRRQGIRASVTAS
jgi:hypothetical protein